MDAARRRTDPIRLAAVCALTALTVMSLAACSRSRTRSTESAQHQPFSSCVVADSCEVLATADAHSAKVNLIANGTNSVGIVLIVRGTPEDQQNYPLPSSVVTLDCVPLAGSDVCLANSAVGVHHGRGAVFSVTGSAITTIQAQLDTFGVLGLRPLDGAHALLWSWTSSAGIGSPDDTQPTAWQTWEVSSTMLSLTGCGPSYRGTHAPPVPTAPLRQSCP